MSQTQDVKNIITELLKDNKVHTTQEIVELAIERCIINRENTTAVHNAVGRMKKENKLVAVGKGMYQQCIPLEKRTVDEEIFEESVKYIDHKVDKLIQFDWINCTDGELLLAREQVMELKRISQKILNSFSEK